MMGFFIVQPRIPIEGCYSSPFALIFSNSAPVEGWFTKLNYCSPICILPYGIIYIIAANIGWRRSLSGYRYICTSLFL
jgi:hypothetical protein